jgi:exodeoxyribonuclease VII large subunit
MQDNYLSLYELNYLIKNALKQSFPESYWIVAEISEMKINYSGHCYLELVEKKAESDTIRARARATIWSSAFRMIQPYFETTTHTRLAAGLKILVKVTVEYHELYGLSLNITDIEPSYTLGELARQKQEIINRLIKEGVFNLNKELLLPRLPRKIALISSDTAAGYGDFIDQLLNNQAGYKFYIKLFRAYMQGEEAEASIIAAMEKAFKYEEFFDVLVIIRGGGAQSELNCFNSYWLASHIAQFPIPVLTGIGHEQDETIADMVAHTRLKTPTAVAEFLISKFQEEENYQHELTTALIDLSQEILDNEKNRLMHLVYTVKPNVQSVIENQIRRIEINNVKLKNAAHAFISGLVQKSTLIHYEINAKAKHFVKQYEYEITHFKNQLKMISRFFIKQQINRLERMRQQNHYNDPGLVLKRGYSITLWQGKPLRTNAELKTGEKIKTILYKGKIESEVIKTDNDPQK